MPNKWHICKEGQAGNKNRQRRGLLMIFELPSLPSAGSRPGCFHTFLGCKPRSIIRVSLGWFDYSKKRVRKDNPTPAYSSVSDRRRLTALVEVQQRKRTSTYSQTSRLEKPEGLQLSQTITTKKYFSLFAQCKSCYWDL
jgi:hypothetical protein